MAKSFVKWAGGKRQLITILDSVIGNIRDKSDSFIYVEPFVGGGSILFHLLSSCSNMKYAIINDANKELINCYRVISDNFKYSQLKDELIKIQTEYNDNNMKESVYKLYRTLYNNWLLGRYEFSDIQGAAIFMFLNKCGFNGLYRVNSKGEFNVPWGKKDYLKIFDESELDNCHVLLNEKVIIMNGDYTITDIAMEIGRVERCDVIYYLDPPYKPISDTSNFTSYTKDVFGNLEQEQLKLFCDNIVRNGGNFVLSNSKCGDYFDNLYKGYDIEIVNAKRNINSIGTKRGNVEEIIIKSK